ncbi:gluconate:H+ symporter, GntP family [Dethiosulfatibacter aminovorans DSM 17477]|uniref:Gluconate:H+ symporter, GntP family n=1 Tax=Dethiosulfatibacter aminovorans DSM 17477 TaxID=1121476 RepID=A0A1M6C4C6_9FIRM|nr:gluconate:H+ symporter [Dethiosulfatibacter aminovorans]SHI55880.1 gluconate:H+ symporter, GntP family [Dethiosulfatibacter aminovorans DSM 17477]
MLTGFGLLIVFVIAIAILLFTIIKMKLNPFLSLLLTSVITGFMVRMPISEISGTISAGFGKTMSGIGIVIGLGIIFGNILSEADATQSIADGLLKRTGNEKAALAVLFAGFLISIPVFMDAAFVIMIPIVKYVAKTTKKSMLTFVTALGVGTIVGHAIVIPTPGPFAVAINMNANVGMFITYSILVSVPAIFVGGWLYGKRFKNYPAYVGESDETAATCTNIEEKSIPSYGLSMFNLLFPIALILFSNIAINFIPEGTGAYELIKFIGDKNIALLIGCFVSFASLQKYFRKDLGTIVIEAAGSAGLILMITGAGGSFGSVINASGIGNYLVQSMSDLAIPTVLLGFILSALLRISQGSTTVAIVTTSSILGPAIAATGIGSPVLVGLAICCGGTGFSLPNDSGFWVLSRFSNLSVKETFNSWTMGGTIAALAGFAVVLILSFINSTVGLPGL